ncbi:Transcriptional activator [Drechslerella dactyloides]|uniref:Transcriptional activator n=1 Tax=Drechslerella dactyloides TaxID=74499 RepID=A0AAD6NM14_DREDA|nr:Transcriptional activator [Drechslerella dactyloides]
MCLRELWQREHYNITRTQKPMGRPRKWPRKEKVLKSEAGSPPSLTNSPVSPDSSDNSSCSDSEVERSFGRYDRTQAPTSGMIISAASLKDKRVRSGCSSCKSRRKKCDEMLPKCGDCSRLGLDCHRGFMDLSPLSDAPGMIPYMMTVPGMMPEPPMHELVDFPELSIFAPSMFPIGTGSEESTLLQHYACVVSRSLSVVPDEINPFLSLFMPMAFEHSAMRYALLGLSASHLRRHHPEFETVMTKYLALAMERTRVLIAEAETSDEAAVEGLATILVLCLHEICEGKSRKWALHMRAACSLINSRRRGKPFPPAVRFLLESTAYFDSMATLSFSKPAMLEEAVYPEGFEDTSNEPMPMICAPRSPVPHALFGTASELFAIINEIAVLAQQRSSNGADFNRDMFFAKAMAIDARLMNWRPKPCVNTVSDPFLCEKMTAASDALKWAAIVRLHQLVYGCDKTHIKVQAGVHHIIAAVSKIPVGDLSESILVFPMLMAGIGAATAEDRLAVRKRMMLMGASIGFGNVFEAHELVEKVWRMEEEEAMRAGPGAFKGVPWDVMMTEVNGQTLIMS